MLVKEMTAASLHLLSVGEEGIVDKVLNDH